MKLNYCLFGLLQALVWCTVAEGALYKTVAIGGPGGENFDDLSALGNVTNFRLRQVLIWQNCVKEGGICSGRISIDGVVGFQTVYSVCENGTCNSSVSKSGLSYDDRDFDDVGATSVIVLEDGDFIEKMYGYISMFPTNGRLYALIGVGFGVNRRGASGDTEEIFIGDTSYKYIEVLGPVVAFWGGVGDTFDQLGAYIDPSVWPERPSRIVTRELYGAVRGRETDVYFNSVATSTKYYAVRLLDIAVYSTSTRITGIAATFQNDLRETVMWNVGTDNAYTHQSNISVSNGSVSIGAIRIPIEDESVDCLSGFAIQLVFSDGRPPEDMVFGSNTTVYNVTEKQIVGFHGLVTDFDWCIRRLGILTQMDSSELKDTCKVPSLSRLADNVTLVLDTDLPERILNGTELKFGCSEGLALVKGGVLTCGDDGIWQGDLPECAHTCEVPSLSRIADHVTLVLDTDLPERILKGTELKFGCSEGYALVKGGVLTCGDDGIWQGDLPECAHTCNVSSLSKLADHVTLVLDPDLPERILKGTEWKFGCNEGFTLVKGGVLTCGDDGIWQGDLPECASSSKGGTVTKDNLPLGVLAAIIVLAILLLLLLTLGTLAIIVVLVLCVRIKKYKGSTISANAGQHDQRQCVEMESNSEESDDESINLIRQGI